MTNNRHEEIAVLKCANNDCGKTFSKPLQALDLQAATGETYEACPYCLSKVPSSRRKILVPTEIPVSKTESFCPHHFGYLHERPDTSLIPDECMICRNLTSCMLKDLKP